MRKRSLVAILILGCGGEGAVHRTALDAGIEEPHEPRQVSIPPAGSGGGLVRLLDASSAAEAGAAGSEALPEPGDAGTAAAPDATPDAAAAPDTAPPPDDEGTCDPCALDYSTSYPRDSLDCPGTHDCGYDGTTSGFTFCLPRSTFCDQEYINGPYKVPPFIGGEYLKSGHSGIGGCAPKVDGEWISCAGWRELVGIPE